LTKGDWEVTQVDAVDEAKGIIYFTATEKSPIERQLYRVSLDGSGFFSRHQRRRHPRHSLCSNRRGLRGHVFERITPPLRATYAADGSKLATLEEDNVPALAEYHLSPVEFFTIKSRDGLTFNCSMIKPPHFVPSKKYPVLTFTYGGAARPGGVECLVALGHFPVASDDGAEGLHHFLARYPTR